MNNKYNELIEQIYFDYIFETDFKDYILEYGIIKGSNKIVVIKPGLEGTLLGKNDYHYKVAKLINKKYGYTVICSNNPNPNTKTTDTLEDLIRIINEYVNDMNYTDYDIYYFGDSNGGVLGARYSYLYPNIKRALLINPPLFISYHKLKDGMLKFTGDKMTFIYGSLDPSYKFVELLDLVDNDKISYVVLENKDHNLADDIELLESLLDEYLLD